jgi:hypothetical protein
MKVPVGTIEAFARDRAWRWGIEFRAQARDLAAVALAAALAAVGARLPRPATDG